MSIGLSFEVVDKKQPGVMKCPTISMAIIDIREIVISMYATQNPLSGFIKYSIFGKRGTITNSTKGTNIMMISSNELHSAYDPYPPRMLVAPLYEFVYRRTPSTV